MYYKVVIKTSEDGSAANEKTAFSYETPSEKEAVKVFKHFHSALKMVHDGCRKDWIYRNAYMRRTADGFYIPTATMEIRILV